MQQALLSTLGRRLGFTLVLMLVLGNVCQAGPQPMIGNWSTLPDAGWSYSGAGRPDTSSFAPTEGVNLTGGRFLFRADFAITAPGRYVLDFQNTSIIGDFRHFILDENNHLVASAEGGIQSGIANPFFLRHGREVNLAVGHYHLISELTSPFYLAQPEPYLDTLAEYQQSIKSGNALVLVGLGVFLGLGIYYAAMAIARRRMAEGMYALFILGNVLFNGSAHLVFTDLFSMHWIYLVSFPILFSNAAYVCFVMALLEIRKTTHPALHQTGVTALTLLGLFILVALIFPHESLEMARYGVGVFLLYGLTAGLVRANQGDISARLYLIAIGTFFVLGAIAITQMQLSGVFAIHIEHVGLFAVAIEVVLLALVLSYQFAQLHREKELIAERLEQSNRIVHTDVLTGLPNRFALDLELDRLPHNGSLSFLDLDNLKYYNDSFGHARGDELLRQLSAQLVTLLGIKGRIFRVGGDEFAITCPSGDVAWVDRVLAECVALLSAAGFEIVSVSVGHAHIHESPYKSDLKHIADVRMYENKQARKLRGI